MDQIPADTQKRKRAQSRPIGCLKLLLIPILLAVACYGGMWVFARYGGEWTISDQIPIPSGSELVNVLVKDEVYGTDIIKHRIYLHSWTSEELRGWFEKRGISFLPECTDILNRNEFINCYESGPYLYGSQEYFMSDPRLALYWISIQFTVPRDLREDWSTIPITSLFVSIYKSQDDFDKTFLYRSEFLDLSLPSIDIPEGKTVFSLRTITSQAIGCWLHFCDR